MGVAARRPGKKPRWEKGIMSLSMEKQKSRVWRSLSKALARVDRSVMGR